MKYLNKLNNTRGSISHEGNTSITTACIILPTTKEKEDESLKYKIRERNP
jgi:hypothetical protein